MMVLGPTAFALAFIQSLALAAHHQTAITHNQVLDDFIIDAEYALDCNSCIAFLGSAKTLARVGDNAFVNTLNRLCVDLHLQDPDVCAGTAATQGPILAHDLRSISTTGRTAHSMCNALVGLCDAPAVIPYSVPFPETTYIRNMHSPPFNSPEASGLPSTFQVMHISDVHIDHQYTVGAEANCSKPICCRNWAQQEQGEEEGSPPVIDPAGPHGHYNCDSPVALASSMLASFERFAENPKFAIFTGDVVERDIWEADQSRVEFDLKAFNAQLASILNIPLYGAMGNHDVAPSNDFPRDSTTDAPSVDWAFELLSEGWEQWINSTAADQILHTSGSYSIDVPGVNLKLISLNTVYWYKANLWLFDSDIPEPDPNAMIAFLVQELQAAEDAGQRAWIVGHMPPGSHDMFHDQSNYHDQVLQRYQATIAGSFYGHSHRDQFEVGYSDYSHRSHQTANNFALIGPALTPTSGNPAFKMYDVDRQTLELMDVRVFITNLSKPDFHTKPIEWELYYSVRDTYGPMLSPPLPTRQPLTPAFWHNVTEVFESNPDALALYIEHLTRGVDVPVCVGRCAESTICALRAMRSEDNCFEPTYGLPHVHGADDAQAILASGGIQDLREDNKCEPPGMEYLLRHLAGRPLRQLIREDSVDYLSDVIQKAQDSAV